MESLVIEAVTSVFLSPGIQCSHHGALHGLQPPLRPVCKHNARMMGWERISRKLA